MDAKQVLQDPEFHAAPLDVKIKYLSDIDSEFAGAPRSVQEDFFKSYTAPVAPPTPMTEPTPDTGEGQPAQGHGLLDRLGGRVDRTVEMFDRQFSGGTMQDVSNIPVATILAGGQVAGGAIDVAGTALLQTAKAVTPDWISEPAKKAMVATLNTKAGRKGLELLGRGVKKWDQFSTDFPDSAMALESVFNLSGIAGTKALTREPLKEVFRLSKDAARLVAVPDQKIMSAVKTGIAKGVRPSVFGKSSFSQTEGYFKKAKEAVETIVENKDKLVFTDDVGTVIKGQLPKTLNEFNQAIDLVKRDIFAQYDELAKRTGATIDMDPIIKELEAFSRKRVVWTLNKGSARHAMQVAEDLERGGRMTASQAQEFVKEINNKLVSFYKNPTYAEAHSVAVEARIADYLRKQLDEKITAATGEGYGALKQKYSALKAIEKEVNHRAIVDMRKNPKGLIDFSDIFTSTQAIYAIANKNPQLFAASAVGKMIATYYRKITDPNNSIKKMFEAVDNLSAQKGEMNSKLFNDFLSLREVRRRDAKNKKYFQDIDNGNQGIISDI